MIQNNPFKIIFLVIAILISSSFFFIVDQREKAVVFMFGEAIRVIEKPGLNYKIPFINDVKFFDKRIQQVSAEPKELTASDEKRIIVDVYAKYRIIDPVRFYQTVRDISTLKSRLDTILESSMREVIGRISLTTLLSSKRNDIMREIREFVKNQTEIFGIEIVDVRILRADLPNENSKGIFTRMQTDREKEAKQIRAEGAEESEIIKSRASRDAQIIRAEAHLLAKKIRADADAKAADIYNNSYKADPEFYEFRKHIEAYSESFSSKDTIFVLSPDSPFLKYLKMSK